tara:strand:+ start:200 stop:784 length:585 start_codon:yes stop_codon:yes gene_type:complete
MSTDSHVQNSDQNIIFESDREKKIYEQCLKICGETNLSVKNTAEYQKDLYAKCRRILKLSNIPLTQPRINLLIILMMYQKPLTVEDIIRLSNGQIATSSIYRNINDLKDKNILDEFQTPDNTKVICLSGNDQDHHHHIFCKSCGSINDIELDSSFEKAIAKEIKKIESIYNVTVDSHSLELLSVCNQCHSTKSN